MSHTRSYSEIILPLTNSRGFRKILRFNYEADSEYPLPLIVSPQILFMGQPYFTRQALYFLSDVDSSIRMYQLCSHVSTNHTEADLESRTRRAADDCLFEYSIRNADSRLTTRSDIPPKRTNWERIEITEKNDGLPDARYLAVDNERAYIALESKPAFDAIYSAYIADLHDAHAEFTKSNIKSEAFPIGLCVNGIEAAPVRFLEIPYTYDELEFLSRFVPVNPGMIGQFSCFDLISSGQNELSREAIVSMLNQPYIEQATRFPPEKWLEPEIIEVRQSYNPRLLDFYFAGLRSLSPIVEFKNYYNILEYYFEDASLDNIKSRLDEVVFKLKQTEDFGEFSDLAKQLQPLGAENQQIRQVVQQYVPLARLRKFFQNEISKQAKSHFENYNGFINGKEIQKIRLSNPNLQDQVADRVYAFRNAIFHS